MFRFNVLEAMVYITVQKRGGVTFKQFSSNMDQRGGGGGEEGG